MSATNSFKTLKNGDEFYALHCSIMKILFNDESMVQSHLTILESENFSNSGSAFKSKNESIDDMIKKLEALKE